MTDDALPALDDIGAADAHAGDEVDAEPMIAFAAVAATKPPYLARSLVILRDSINAVYTHRDHGSDGWIGDTAHQARKSEHNPDSRGCVHALDIDIDDNDPGHDLRKELLAATVGHRAVWYVISDGIIYSRTYSWRPRQYAGTNGHFHHVHISIRLAADAENDATLKLKPRTPPKPKPKPAGGGSALTTYTLGSRVIKTGSRGTDVAFVQRFLGIPADGIYGKQTDAAVRRYQKMRGVTVDGIVGPKTWKPMLRSVRR